MRPTRRAALTALAAPLLCAVQAAHARPLPGRPLRVVVPYAAGGGTDALARQITRRAAQHLGQEIVVHNKPGAGGTIAAADVARAPADGHTLLWGDSATFAFNPHVYEKLNYDPGASFTPVTLTIHGMLALSAAPGRLPVKNLNQLISHARANPGRLSYGSAGSGTPHHLAMESFKLRAGGLSIQHIPYRGEAPAMQDLVSGNLDLMFSGIRLAHAQEDGCRILTLAVSGPQRSRVIPHVPTLNETGLGGFTYRYWHGLVAPAGTPSDIVERLNAAFNEALADPEVAAWVRDVCGADPAGGTPHEMEAFMARELLLAGALVQAIHLKRE